MAKKILFPENIGTFRWADLARKKLEIYKDSTCEAEIVYGTTDDGTMYVLEVNPVSEVKA